MKRRVTIAVVILGAIALGAGLLAAVPRLPDRGSSVPTAKSCGPGEP